MCRGVKPLYKGKQLSLWKPSRTRSPTELEPEFKMLPNQCIVAILLRLCPPNFRAQPFRQRGQLSGGRLLKVLHSFIPQFSPLHQWPIRAVSITENINILAILKENKATSLLPFGSNMGLLGCIYLLGLEK